MLLRGRVLIVAGSDSGGGAGIQADIKTITALGAYAATAITALTAQDTHGVHGIHEVPIPFLRQQMELVLDDIGADAVKTGMLHSQPVIETVAEVLRERAAGIALVVDPVMVAKSGDALLAEAAVAALKARLLPLAHILTPNLPEAEVLTGMRISDLDAMREAGRRLLDCGPRAVLVKGGHLRGERLTDLLVTASGEAVFEGQREPGRHTHGTGCTLASAIAAGLAQGLDVRDAVARARDYVVEAIRTAPGFGGGQGPLNHAHTIGRFKASG